MIRPQFAVLSDLIVLAEQVVTRPQSARSEIIRRAELLAEVRHADARPAEGIRTTRAALVMVIVLEELLGGIGDGQAELGWLIIAGAMLPQLRAEAFKALRNEREQRR